MKNKKTLTAKVLILTGILLMVSGIVLISTIEQGTLGLSTITLGGFLFIISSRRIKKLKQYYNTYLMTLYTLNSNINVHTYQRHILVILKTKTTTKNQASMYQII